MSELKDKIQAALESAAQPAPYALTTLGGLEVYILQLTPRQVREWWLFEYGAPGKRPLYDQIICELFARCCVDATGQRLFESSGDAAKLRDQAGGGKALEEFAQEARRVNWLFLQSADAEKERARFFSGRGKPTNPTTATAAIPWTGSLPVSESATAPPIG